MKFFKSKILNRAPDTQQTLHGCSFLLQQAEPFHPFHQAPRKGLRRKWGMGPWGSGALHTGETPGGILELPRPGGTPGVNTVKLSRSEQHSVQAKGGYRAGGQHAAVT